MDGRMSIAMNNTSALTHAHQMLAKRLIISNDGRLRKCYDALERAFSDAIRAEAERLIPDSREEVPAKQSKSLRLFGMFFAPAMIILQNNQAGLKCNAMEVREHEQPGIRYRSIWLLA